MVLFRGLEDLLAKSEKEIRQFRGKEIAMIFQDPLSTVNPVLTVGDRIVESYTGFTIEAAACSVDLPLERLKPFVRRRLEGEMGLEAGNWR